MRPLRQLGLSLASVLLCAEGASAVTMERVLPRLMSRGDFTSLTEYFTGHETHDGRTIVRSEPERREGYYFIIALDQSVASLPAGAQVVADVIPASTGKPQTHSFAVDAVEADGHMLYVGLTGEEWSGSPALLAWQLKIVDAQGATLAHEQSFLWELPQ